MVRVIRRTLDAALTEAREIDAVEQHIATLKGKGEVNPNASPIGATRSSDRRKGSRSSSR